jgi:hypothetical protein
MICLATGLALVAGCGYGFKSGQVREGLETVGVGFFENRTTEPDAELALTEAVIRLLIEDRTLRIADEQVADAILYGIIRRYQFQTAYSGADRQAEEYRLDITVEVQLVDRRSGETIIGPERVNGTGSFFVDDGPEAEEQARLDAFTMIVQGILNLVVEEW